MHAPRTSRSLPAVLALLSGLALVTLSAAPAAAQERLPVQTGESSKISGPILPEFDEDSFALDLLVGDVVTVSVKDVGPTFGLLSTLELLDPLGADTGVAIPGNGTTRPSLTFTAQRSGTHVLTLRGNQDGLIGDQGYYSIQTKIQRLKPQKVTLTDPAGGAIDVRFGVQTDAQISVTVAGSSSNFELTELRRPDATAEPTFNAALKVKGKGKKAQLKKFTVTGGTGVYALRGTYDAGTTLKIKVKIKAGLKKVNTRLDIEEPVFDALVPPFPSRGIAGTVVTVFGRNFTVQTRKKKSPIVPEFRIGALRVDPDGIEIIREQVLRFPIPAGLTPGVTYDLTMTNADGQRSVVRDAFTHAVLPQLQTLSIADGGPGGGRAVRLTGSGLNDVSVVLFGDTVADAQIVTEDRVDVVSPRHAVGLVSVTVRDEHGQTSTLEDAFTFLDVGTNEITSVAPARVQGLGGETVVVTGVDFAADTVLTLGGADVGATLESPTEMRFVAPTRPGGILAVRIEDQYGQNDSADVTILGFPDISSSAVPTPNTGTNVADGWRATRILSGLINDDLVTDLVLLRPAAAFGGDADRSRVRIFLGDGSGGYTDGTAGIPAVTATDDWRANDGVLIDVDGDDDLDLAIVTTELLDGGNRSSLRVLLNDGDGAFTDDTDNAMPVTTAANDANQGVALAVAFLDAGTEPDLIVTHSTSFIEIQDNTPPIVDPENPPEPVIDRFDFAGTRVLLNTSGVFARDDDALPAVDENDIFRFEGDAMVAGDIDKDTDVDIVVTHTTLTEDPDNPGTFLRSAIVLRNDGTGTFTDESALLLPAAGDPEYLQGDGLVLADLDGDSAPELLIRRVRPIVSPVSGLTSADPALRLFSNSGAGVFTATTGVFPDALSSDLLQAMSIAVGDLTGNGSADIVLASSRPPNLGGRGLRVLVNDGTNTFSRGSTAFPNPVVEDDGRGAVVSLVDTDGDGDLDIVLSRDEADETARNTRIFENPRP